MGYIYNNPSNVSGVLHTTGVEFAYQLKELLKRAGWTVPQSGTGTSGSYGTSDLITSAAVLGTSRAWFEIRDPAGTRAFTFQRISNDANFRIKYAATGGFAAGTEDTTGAANTAAEEKVLLGSGTDASPSGGTFGSVSGSKLLYMVADNEAPYGFCVYSKAQASSTDHTLFFLDPLRPGSYANTDTDPVVIGCVNGWTSNGLTSLNSGGLWAWFVKDTESAAFQNVGASYMAGWMSSNNLSPGGGTDPETGKDITIPLIWGRAPGSFSAPAGWKGVSSLFTCVLASRQNGDTLSEASTRDRILIQYGQWAMPWNGAIPLV